MTAIFAAVRCDGHDTTVRAEADRMAAALARFGEVPTQLTQSTLPDGASAVIGKRLMPLLDEDRYPDPLSPLARTALPNPRWTVAADVRLTDRAGLATALDLPEAAAAQLSDAMLVAHAFERWGTDAPQHIDGPFAIIAIEVATGRVLLARDFTGDRPLLFHVSQNGLWAASMPEGLNALPHLPRAANEQGYESFLRAIEFEGTHTPYAGLERVLPGHVATWQPQSDKVTQVRHWEPDTTPLRLANQAEYEAALSAALDAAVAASLRGAGSEVAAHLSAGFDSTAVVVTAARLLAPSGGRVCAFTAVPRPGPKAPLPSRYIGDEGDLAAQTAAMHANVDHVRVTATTGPIEGMERALLRYGMPVLNICNLPWVDAIAEEAKRRRLTVLLQAAMGNATISESGVEALPELLRAGRLPTWWRLARGFVRNGWMRWSGIVWNSIAPMLPRKVYDAGQRLTGRGTLPLRRFSPLRDDAYAAGPAFPDIGPGAFTSVANRIAILSEDSGILKKADLAHFGLDIRDPTADPALVRLALRIPVERLCWNGEPRAILRAILSGQAPEAVLHTRKRGYQAADWTRALHDERDMLKAEINRLAEYEPAARMVDIERLNHLVETMPEPDSPAWADPGLEIDYRYAVLRCVSATRHMRLVAGSNH
ncbi:asparagine synthase-related protein [Novosphingobium cyanobacteriorum]|uniref:asparagine synthase (glutamine-hydrolyzing) n=1 Tax=Novosphingobium cyanobacteriorum TaxID=3024215 RepID=A0ABT6CEX9_9SPHN|nr:asparagine synthetase B family protein [Novosphingobium cyanobacteriorum]MDF8332456.1 asparagine synthetase B family protein [Novosphingobium cyanobacteriorum]